MKWLKLDDVNIICKTHNKRMIVESIRYNGYDSSGILVCPRGGERINLETHGKFGDDEP